MSRHSIHFVLLAAIASLLLAAPDEARSSTQTGQSASDFMTDVSWMDIRAQYGKMWSKLHPRYQRVTTRTFWESCQRKQTKARAGIEIHSLKAIDEYPDVIKVPLLGTRKTQPVTPEMRYSHPLLGNNRTLTDTIHAVRWGNTWKGLWEPDTHAVYAKHRCPE